MLRNTIKKSMIESLKEFRQNVLSLYRERISPHTKLSRKMFVSIKNIILLNINRKIDLSFVFIFIVLFFFNKTKQNKNERIKYNSS